MWQICPMCRGTKVSRKFVNSYILDEDCHICNGKGILHELTGMPPNTNIGGYEYEITDSPIINLPELPSVITGEKNVEDIW